MKQIKKRYFFLGFFILIIALVLFFLSSIVKNWVVKNSEELIGRKIEIADLHFNYFKMTVTARGVVMYEANKKDTFVSFRELFADFSPWKLIHNEYSLSEIRIDSLAANILQTNTGFNFDSLIPAEDSTDVAEQDTSVSNVKFSLYNVKLTNGNLKYEDKTINNKVTLKNINVGLPLIAWNQNQSDMGAKFNIGAKGIIEVAAVVKNSENSYSFNINTTNVPIRFIKPYLKDYADISELNGLLTSRVQIDGDLHDFMNVTITGNGKVDSLSVKDGTSKEIIKATEVKCCMSEISLKKFYFGFSNIEVKQPFIATVFDKDMSNIERFLLPYFTADSMQNSSESANATELELEPTYRIDTLIVNKGNLMFADNTLNRKFNSFIRDLDITMYNLTESSDKVPVTFSAKINKDGGSIEGKTILSMAEPMNFELDGKLKKIDLISFSPYSEYYIASPMTQGWFNYDIQVKMSPTWLNNENKIKIEELEFGNKTDDKAKYKVPIRLGLYVMKDVNDNIDINMPVSGSTSDPHFKLRKLIWKTFVNLMIKTAASPFNALASLSGSNPEDLEYLKFALTQDSLDQKQLSTLNSLAKIMNKKAELKLTMSQRTDAEREMAQLAVQMAQKKYESEKQGANFEEYLRKQVPEVETIGKEEACMQLVTQDKVRQKFIELLDLRNELLRNFFISQGISEDAVRVLTSDLKTLPEEIRKPEYKVEVSLK